jgi:hypothetical protein
MERKIPYRHLLSQWVPTGIYVVFIQGFALSPSLRFGDASIFSNEYFFIFHSAGMAWLPPAKPCPWDMNETSNPKVSLELRGGFYAA